MIRQADISKKILPAIIVASALAVFTMQPAAAQTAGNVVCNGCVASKDIKNNGIKSKDIKNGQVKNADLADDAVDSDKVQDNSIASTDLSNEAGASGDGGSQNLALSSTASTVRSVTLTAPSDGLVIVNASGTFNLVSAEARCSIATGTALDFDALLRASSEGSEREAWGATRIFNQSAGSQTYNLVCDVFFGTASVEDTQLTAIFVPTAY